MDRVLVAVDIVDTVFLVSIVNWDEWNKLFVLFFKPPTRIVINFMKKFNVFTKTSDKGVEGHRDCFR